MDGPVSKQDLRRDEFGLMVTLGESITAGGWSSSPERCWPSRLAALISDVQSEPITLVNSGIGANVISTRSTAYEHSGKPAASERLDKHVIAHKPDLVTVSYGLNDARGGTPLDVFVEELESVVDRIREGCDPVIVLLGPYFIVDFGLGGDPWSHGSPEIFEAYNQAIADVATAKGCLFVDLLSAYGGAEWMVHRDGVHANDLSHAVLASAVFGALARNCSGLAKHTKDREQGITRWRDESALIEDHGYTLKVVPKP